MGSDTPLVTHGRDLILAIVSLAAIMAVIIIGLISPFIALIPMLEHIQKNS